MKIEIDDRGYLRIERAGKFKEQDCPHGAELGVWCGDWCPLFGEPERNEVSKGYDVLVLCERSLVGTIEDKRGAK